MNIQKLSRRGAIALAFVGVMAMAQQAQTAEHPSDKMLACAKSCAVCQQACDVCANHCAHLLADGKKEHLACMRSCLDCSTCCVACGQLCSRGGSCCVLMCECCAKACDLCAAACEKFPDDKDIKACAAECRKCLTACKGVDGK